MPLFNYGQPFGQAPGYTPSGRGVSYTKDQAKAADILGAVNAYGYKPGQYTQAQIDWAKGILPNQAPVVKAGRLQSPISGLGYGDTKGFMGAVRSGMIGPESSMWGALNPGQQNSAMNFRNAFFPNNSFQGAMNRPSGPAGFTPAAPAPTQMTPSGRSVASGPPVAAQGGFTSGTTPSAAISGAIGGLQQQWNDQNDPGGFIRKFQSQQGNQPWTGLNGGSQYFSPGQSRSFNIGG